MKKYFVVLGLFVLGGVCSVRTSAQDPNYEGFFDVGDCNAIAGWAAAKNRPNVSINVGLYVDSVLVSTILANQSRPDVGQAIGDNGLHGFNFNTPLALRNGQAHSVSIRFESSSTELSLSPRTINCAPAAFTLPNPKITSFEIRPKLGSLPPRISLPGLNESNTTTDPSLGIQVEIDHSDRVHFYRLGEISCPESVSDRPEDRMKNLSWQPFTQGQSFSFRLSTNIGQPYGTRCVYMEVNTSQNESSASPAKGDSVVLVPAGLKTFTLTGTALKTFIDRAKAVGYKFTVTSHSFTDVCPLGTIPDVSSLTKVKVSDARIIENTAAKIFDRGDGFLNVFWKMTDIGIPGNGASVTIGGPLSGRQDDPFRTVGVKQGFSGEPGSGGSILGPTPSGNLTCAAGDAHGPGSSFDTSLITSITLEGPGDKHPEDAFFVPNKDTRFKLRLITPSSRP